RPGNGSGGRRYIDRQRCLRVHGLSCAFNTTRDLVQGVTRGSSDVEGVVAATTGVQFDLRFCNPLVSAPVSGRGPHAHAADPSHGLPCRLAAGTGGRTPSPSPRPPP